MNVNIYVLNMTTTIKVEVRTREDCDDTILRPEKIKWTMIACKVFAIFILSTSSFNEIKQ